MVRVKTLLIASLLVAACAGQAITFQYVSVGTYTGGYTSTESAVFQNDPMSVPFFTANGVVNNPGPSQFLTATAVFSDGGANSMTVNYSTSPVVFQGNSASYAGTWNYVSGTGAYANMSGGGTMTAIFDTDFNSTHSFFGDLQAVPEPASMAVLGLGVAALLRRRRK